MGSSLTHVFQEPRTFEGEDMELAGFLHRLGQIETSNEKERPKHNLFTHLLQSFVRSHVKRLHLRRRGEVIFEERVVSYRGHAYQSNFWVPRATSAKCNPLFQQQMKIHDLARLVITPNVDEYLFRGISEQDMQRVQFFMPADSIDTQVVKYITQLPYSSEYIPMVQVDRNIFTTPNGVLDVRRDRFYEFGSAEFAAMDRTYSSSNFWDQMPLEWDEWHRRARVGAGTGLHDYDWVKLLRETRDPMYLSEGMNAFYKVYYDQFRVNPFTGLEDAANVDETLRWRLALLGMMMFYKRTRIDAIGGKSENFQVVPYDFGAASSGKSTMIGVIGRIYPSENMYTMVEGAQEKEFGLGMIFREGIYTLVINETQGQLPLPYSQFLAIVSGDPGTAPRKNDTTLSVQMLTPATLSGNDIAPLPDTQGQGTRRLVGFHHQHSVFAGDPGYDAQLGTKIERMHPLIMLCAYKCYLQKVDQWGDRGIPDAALSPSLLFTRHKMFEKLNPLHVFMLSHNVVISSHPLVRVPFEQFVQAYRERMRNFKAPVDPLSHTFKRLGVKYVEDMREGNCVFNGVSYKNKPWLVGCSLQGVWRDYARRLLEGDEASRERQLALIEQGFRGASDYVQHRPAAPVAAPAVSDSDLLALVSSGPGRGAEPSSSDVLIGEQEIGAFE